MATDLLVTTSDLEVWTQSAPGSLAADPLAIQLVIRITGLLRDAGDSDWTAVTPTPTGEVAVPNEAQLIGILKAKRFWENREENKQETLGPINSSKDFVEHLVLTDEERSRLAVLAQVSDPTGRTGGLFAIRTEVHGSGPAEEDFYVTDQSGSDWMIPFVRLGDRLYPRW